ncbi:MAG TPA: hypothetical protein VKR06_18870 [Ktedonosporobacter sp.]|nr:hypothetical protein [Ktedonosporobacter sp.]
MEPSAMLSEIARQLRQAGLEARLWPFKGNQALIAEAFSPNDHRFNFSNRACIIESLGDQWIFHHEGIGTPPGGIGPSSDQIEYPVSTPEEIIAITLQFYLGKPLLIEEWIVPLHRHPEWNEHDLRHLLAHVQPLSPNAWDQVYAHSWETSESLRKRLRQGQPVAWQEWLACWFVFIQHQTRVDDTLCLRRDLQEAFHVREMCPWCQQESLTGTRDRFGRRKLSCSQCERRDLEKYALIAARWSGL